MPGTARASSIPPTSSRIPAEGIGIIITPAALASRAGGGASALRGRVGGSAPRATLPLRTAESGSRALRSSGRRPPARPGPSRPAAARRELVLRAARARRSPRRDVGDRALSLRREAGGRHVDRLLEEGTSRGSGLSKRARTSSLPAPEKPLQRQLGPVHEPLDENLARRRASPGRDVGLAQNPSDAVPGLRGTRRECRPG